MCLHWQGTPRVRSNASFVLRAPAGTGLGRRARRSHLAWPDRVFPGRWPVGHTLTHPPALKMFPPACCGADNVPGVSGIGPKTAATLLREHGSLAALLEAAAGGDIKPKKAAAALVSGEQG